MLLTTLVVFFVAALLGLTVAVQLFKKKPTSKAVAVTHGLVGAIGLVLLIVFAVQHPAHMLSWAIGLLVVAALGGAWVFVNDLRQKPGPLGLVVIHALLAVAAVVLVLMVAVG